MSNGSPTPMMDAVAAVLADGQRHLRDELLEVMKPSGIHAVRMMVGKIRKVLRPKGQDIVCEYNNGRFYYRHVRLMPSSDDGS